MRLFRDELSEEFQRRGIRPVQILDHEQDRLTTSMSAQPLWRTANVSLGAAGTVTG